MEKFSRAWDNRNSCIVHIRELPKETRNGAKCDCICVECEGALEACQGDIRTTWYFRHQSKTICHGGPMTALHLLAQELLSGDRTIKIKGGEVSYFKATKEWAIPESRFRADVAGTKDDSSQFLIEIFVTHKLKDDEEKVRFIRDKQIQSIEIDLSKVDPEIAKNELLVLLLTDVSKQHTIYRSQDGLLDKLKKESNWYDDIVPIAFAIGLGYAAYKFFTRRRVKRRR